MHWIKTIRHRLNLSQEDLADYLGVSLDTVKSVEIGRRLLPLTSLRPAMIIFQAITASQSGDVTSDLASIDDRQTRRRKILHGRYQRTLVRCERRLESMQHTYNTAIANLGVYQHIAQSLTDQDDPKHRRWTERKIEETAQQLKNSDTDTQGLLHVQISILKGFTRTLEERQASDQPDDPQTV